MKSFILHSSERRSVRDILLYALLFYIVTLLFAGIIQALVTKAYLVGWGLVPKAMLGGRDADTMAETMGWRTAWHALLLAPLVEEGAFRLWLSFRRIHVAIGAGAFAFAVLPWFFVEMDFSLRWALSAGIALFVAALVYRFSTDDFWESKCVRWQYPMMWSSAIVFALFHLFSVTGLSWVLIPYVLVYLLRPFCAGCVLAYLRVNLGFGWAVGAHMFMNLIPTLFVVGTLLE